MATEFTEFQRDSNLRAENSQLTRGRVPSSGSDGGSGRSSRGRPATADAVALAARSRIVAKSSAVGDATHSATRTVSARSRNESIRSGGSAFVRARKEGSATPWLPALARRRPLVGGARTPDRRFRSWRRSSISK